MKRTFLMCAMTIGILSILSCTSNDVKEISGTILFNDPGSHTFNINADNIDATITMVGPNQGETLVLEGVKLFRTSNYSAKIGTTSTGQIKTELLDNLVVMYEVSAGDNSDSRVKTLNESGYIKIDWKGLN